MTISTGISRSRWQSIKEDVMGLLSWVRNLGNGACKSAPASKEHWKHGDEMCAGSGGRVVQLQGRRGTCPVCQANNLAITRAGLSWPHLNRGYRRVTKGVLNGKA